MALSTGPAPVSHGHHCSATWRIYVVVRRAYGLDPRVRAGRFYFPVSVVLNCSSIEHRRYVERLTVKRLTVKLLQVIYEALKKGSTVYDVRA